MMISTSQALQILRNNASISDLSKTNQDLIVSLNWLSQMLNCGNAFQTKVGQKFVAYLPEHLRKNNHSIVFLNGKAGSTCWSISGNGKLTQNKHLKWYNCGLMINGAVLTVKVSEAPRVAKECILSDILQDKVLKKYFVSKQVLDRILKQ